MAKATNGVGKDDLIGDVAGTTELTKGNAKKVIKQSGKLRLVNFGIFSVKQTKERQGRNPATGQAITIPPGFRMGFKVSRSWKEGMMARKREQDREKIKIHEHKGAPKGKAAAKPAAKPAAKAAARPASRKVTKPPARGKGKKR
jgi:nucleoid DNA-binding protein